MIDLNAVQWIGAAGICWDVSGAIFLARGLFLTDAQVFRLSQSYFDLSPPALRAQIEQRLDGWAGVYSLLLGFLLQFVSAAGARGELGLFLLMVLPIGMTWHFYLHNFNVWVATKALSLSPVPVDERVWRRHFRDLSEADWDTALRLSSAVIIKAS